MSRRIEIEITSLSGDLATWRAAGAKLPKGVLAASLVPGGPVVGNVYRADIEQYMEGIEVLSVTAPKTASPLDPRNERIQLIPEAKKGPDVVVTYASKGRGPRRDSESATAPVTEHVDPGPSARPLAATRTHSATGERPSRGPRGDRPAVNLVVTPPTQRPVSARAVPRVLAPTEVLALVQNAALARVRDLTVAVDRLVPSARTALNSRR